MTTRKRGDQKQQGKALVAVYVSGVCRVSRRNALCPFLSIYVACLSLFLLQSLRLDFFLAFLHMLSGPPFQCFTPSLDFFREQPQHLVSGRVSWDLVPHLLFPVEKRKKLALTRGRSFPCIGVSFTSFLLCSLVSLPATLASSLSFTAGPMLYQAVGCS